MVTLEKIRRDMQARLEIDNTLHNVDVNADTIDEAIADAAVQLDTRAVNLQYEVVEKGSNGFLGFGKKPWKLRIYQNPETVTAQKKKRTAELHDAAGEAVEEQPVDRDGLFYVRHFDANILLKVLPPVGDGRPVDEREVRQVLQRPDTLRVDEAAVRQCIEAGTDGTYRVVGSYQHNNAADAMLAVDVTKDDMLATITATSPGIGGAEISSEMIHRFLKIQGVVAGINEDKIAEFVDNPVYNIPYEVAAAVLPVDGQDAYIAYHFETDPTKLRAREDETGQVNFKNLNLIQNVVAGQALAQKVPAEKGRSGKTLAGRYLEAKNGKDIAIPLGQNTRLDSDGLTVLADVDGQVLIVAGKITVQPLLQLDGVNIKTGNVKFLGTVIIKGNVEDGFDVTASGNIEIGGTVGKCTIIAEGDIIVQQGIFGKETGFIKTGKNLWAKFIQATKVEAEENVFVNDSIMGSSVTAMRNIILSGKKAQITGGHLFATEEICARNIGSPGGGSETVLEVGFDPRAKQQLEELQGKQAELMKELEAIELDVTNLENQKQVRRALPKDKEDKLAELQKRAWDIDAESSTITGEIEKLQEHLRELKAVGKVKASGTVYSGVKIYVRDVLDEVRTEVKSVTFYYDNTFVKRGKYEAPSLERRTPDGYSAN
ncbi:MAG: FapA family protein [Treponema sp.]|nr:FapA family protein [Treponema sp.]